MSFDVLSVNLISDNDEMVEYGIASSCKPSDASGGEKTSYDTTFDHVDGVFITEDPSGDSVFYDVEKKKIRLWGIDPDDGDEYIIDLNSETWFEYNEVLNNLNLLFEDHWPSLGEIAGVLSVSRF